MKTVLFIHQSSELYGSDKALLWLVTEFRKKGIKPIIVLPNNGPLADALHKESIRVIFTPVIKISRKMFGIRNLLSLPFQMTSSLKKINDELKNEKIDLIYSNTLAVLIGLIYSIRYKTPHIWHVHEIIEKPKVVRGVFKKLLSFKANTKIIFNSKATYEFWDSEKKLDSILIYYGIPKSTHIFSNNKLNEIKERLGASSNEILIALVGRINRWKGQQLLLEAYKNICIQFPFTKLVFIGSPPEKQDSYLHELENKIDKYNLTQKVKIFPFQRNIWEIWETIDIAVVPSTDPEPFGLVAVEAMLCAKPVIAARHGGLVDIVIHNETGILFEPNNRSNLEDALRTLIQDSEKRKKMGKKGKARATLHFTQERYAKEIIDVYTNIIK